MEVLKVSRYDQRTRESIGDMNRKHLLREQMHTIQKELGEDDEGGADAELDKAITKARMPEDKVARKETPSASSACQRRLAILRCCAPTSTG